LVLFFIFGFLGLTINFSVGPWIHDPALKYFSGICGTKFSKNRGLSAFVGATPKVFASRRRGGPQRPDALRGELLNQQSGRSRNSGDALKKTPATR
jgi:hypothetical protein